MQAEAKAQLCDSEYYEKARNVGYLIKCNSESNLHHDIVEKQALESQQLEIPHSSANDAAFQRVNSCFVADKI